MADINTRKLGDKWEYYFETAKMDGKRKRFNKVGFSTIDLQYKCNTRKNNNDT